MRAREKDLLSRQAAVEADAAARSIKDSEAAREYLTRYTANQAELAWDAVRKLAAELGGPKIWVQSEDIRISEINRDIKRGSLTVTIFSSAGFDASKIDIASIRFGPGYMRCDD